MNLRSTICFLLLFAFGINTALAGLRVSRMDGITFTGADGITFTGADGITFTGADNFLSYQSNGITFTGADGITFTGADGITFTGADGSTYTGPNGITFTGADGTISNLISPNGITFTGADGITLTGADGITLTGADGITFTGADQYTTQTSGLQSVDPELAVRLDQMTDDSNINAVIVFHRYPTDADLAQLQEIGIIGGTKYHRLPFVSVTTTRANLLAVSHLAQVRSIYGNRTLNFNADSFLAQTNLSRVATDRDLQIKNYGMPVSGRNVTVAVLDTGVNAQHNDLSNKVAQNVRLADSQSVGAGFTFPAPIENLPNTDAISGHGTFVAGLVGSTGSSSGGKFSGVAPGARILGMSAGDLNLTYVLAGFDYLLDRGANYNTRVVNCSFSTNTVFDFNDPVNIATKILTDNNISVVFSAGNAGPGNGTLNPYAAAPWVVSVGATDEKGRLASFSSRGVFGNRQFSPTLVAPAVNVASLRAAASQTGILGMANGVDVSRLTPAELPFYTTASGTSFSAPQVAGTIALMLEANPNLTPLQIKRILQSSATPLPPYFRHEVGAGMLNVYAAVLQSAFADRKMGLFRSVLERRIVNFSTATSQNFAGTVLPGTTVQTPINLADDTVQATVNIAWGNIFTANDLALKLTDANGNAVGSSNSLNTPGFTGKREHLTLNNPLLTLNSVVSHTANIGTSQQFFGNVQSTRAQIAALSDTQTLSPQAQSIVKESLRSFIMLPDGNRFRPFAPVSRADLAAALIRGGRVPQYLAGNPLYADVKDLTTRIAVESVQKSPNGALIANVSNAQFRPDEAATKLIAAIALVKAANLQPTVFSATLPVTLLDANQIPSEWRGYVAVALQKGFLSTNNNKFSPNSPLTRLELAQALVKLNNLAIQ